MSQFVVLHGAAGSGKGTISKALVQLDYNLIGAGEEIRQYIATNGLEDQLAFRMHQKLAVGLNVETADLFEVIEKKIIALTGQNILGDGLVRESDQASWLANFSEQSEAATKFINLVAPFDVLNERLLNRYFVPGNPFPFLSYEDALSECQEGVTPIARQDDNPDAIQSRFRQYEEKLQPIIEIISSSPNIEYIEIDANNPPHTVLSDVILAI